MFYNNNGLVKQTIGLLELQSNIYLDTQILIRKHFILVLFKELIIKWLNKTA